jgi:hypothetical protein
MSERRWQEYIIDKLELKEKYRRVELRKEHFSVEKTVRRARLPAVPSELCRLILSDAHGVEEWSKGSDLR